MNNIKKHTEQLLQLNELLLKSLDLFNKNKMSLTHFTEIRKSCKAANSMIKDTIQFEKEMKNA